MKKADIFSSLADIFSPLFPAFMTAGLCAGFSSLLTQVFPSAENSLTVFFLNLVNSAFSNYIPVWVGWMAGRKFHASSPLLALLAMTGLMDEASKIAGFLPESIGPLLTGGSGGVLAIIAAAYVLSHLEAFLGRLIPKPVRKIFTPFLSFLIILFPYMFLLLPFFGILSNMICQIISYLIFNDSAVFRLISGYICAALFLPITVCGLNYAFVALYMVQLEISGSISLYPVFAMAGASQVGMALCVSIKAGKERLEGLRSVALSGIVPGLLGVGTPLLYGLSMSYGKLLASSCLGAGLGGAFIVLAKVASNGWGPSGLLAIPLMCAGSSSPVQSMIYYVAGLLISLTGGFAVTSLTVKSKELVNAEQHHVSDQDTF